MIQQEEISEVESGLKSISVNSSSLTDITDVFNNLQLALNKEDPNKVFKSSFFDLFTATSALEVNSSNLDTSLIVNEHNSVYNTSVSLADLKTLMHLQKETDVAFVLIDYIFRSFVNWIKDNGSLTTNLISIKYVEEILSEYTETLQIKSTFNSGDWLIDDLLRFSVVSLLFVVKILSLNCSANDYIREEEDIRFDSLGLNFLNEHSFERDIKDDYKKCIEKVSDNGLKSMCLFIYNFTVFISDNMDPDCVSTGVDAVKGNIAFFEELCESFELLKKNRSTLQSIAAAAKIPENLKTSLPQRTYSNGFPTKKIPDIPLDNYVVIENIIENLKITIPLLKNNDDLIGSELAEKIYYSFTNQFQYYYDDENIENNEGRIGALNRIFFLARFVDRDMTSINGTKIMKHITEDIKSVLFLNEETASILLSEEQLMQGPMALELQSLHQIYLESMLSKLRNQCQYRQAFSKQLLYWDSSQANIAQFEDPYPSDLANNLDKFPAISLWIYHQKLNSMAEFLLRGFALNLYSGWEFFSIYWNSYCIINENYSLLSQFQQYNKLLLQRYEAQNLSKNLKKKHKDAAKRTRIKERNCKYIESLLNILQKLESHLVETEILSLLCFVQCLRYIQLLKGFSNKDAVLQFLNQDSSTYIYEIRFKAFESIGSPQLPKHGIWHIINTMIDDAKIETYVSTALEKLSELKLKLPQEKPTIEKQEFWQRISSSIDQYDSLYKKPPVSSKRNGAGTEFFELRMANETSVSCHEFFPVLC